MDNSSTPSSPLGPLMVFFLVGMLMARTGPICSGGDKEDLKPKGAPHGAGAATHLGEQRPQAIRCGVEIQIFHKQSGKLRHDIVFILSFFLLCSCGSRRCSSGCRCSAGEGL